MTAVSLIIYLQKFSFWNIEISSAFQLFGAAVNSSVMDNINIAPQRPVKCIHKLLKKFEFITSLSVTLRALPMKNSVSHQKPVLCLKKQEPKDSRNTSFRACSIKQNCKKHAPYGILHMYIPQLHVHPSVILMVWLSAQPDKRINL